MGKIYDKHLKAVFGKNHEAPLVLTDGSGLSVRVSAKGKVRWQYRYKINGKNKRMDLGDYPALSLLKARELARQCREWLAEGYDPKHKRSLERVERLTPVSVKDALEYWLVEYAEDNRSNVGKHRSQFERHIYPFIGQLPLAQVETRHWVECFDRIRKGMKGKQRPAPVASGYILQNAKQALRFCRVRKYGVSRALDDLVVSDIGSKQTKKDRFLTASEVSDVLQWTDSTKLLPYYSKMIRLLMVFGARTQEVRLSTWSEWDFSEMLWTIPKVNSKNNERILRPIPSGLKDWLLKLKGDAKYSDYILGEVKSPESVSQLGRNLWKRMDHAEAWTLHDLRRTFTTYLNDMGIAPHVVEQLSGHQLGGMMSIYNRSQYLPEKRVAINSWLEHLEAISSKDQSVVSFVGFKTQVV